MRSGTHTDLEVWSKSRCFACRNNRLWLGPIETSNSGAKHAVLYAQNYRLYLGPIETCYSGLKVALLQPKTTDESWESKRQVILVQNALFCMHKTTDEF